MSRIPALPLDMATRAAAHAVDAILDVHGTALDAQAEGQLLDPASILPVIQAANEAAQRAHRLMIAEGGKSPMLEGVSVSQSDRFDLSALVQLDTPDTRLLLAMLEQVQIVAERVDASRGRTLPEDTLLQPGESRGTDIAESVSELALRVRREVEGAKGRE